MAALDVQFCSRALILVAANSIQSFEDGSAEAEVAASNYSSIRNNLITEHPWSFTKKKSPTLNQLVDTPNSEFDFAYQLPSDFFNLLAVYPNTLTYDIFQSNRLLTSLDGDISIDYQFSTTTIKRPGDKYPNTHTD